MIGFRTDKIEVFNYFPLESIEEDRFLSRDQKIDFMISKLINDSKNVFFYVIFDKEILKAFLFAFIVNNSRYCFIEHAWSKGEVEQGLVKKGFILLEEFCRDRKIKVLKMQTIRNPISMCRKWGFEVASYNMIKEIED